MDSDSISLCALYAKLCEAWPNDNIFQNQIVMPREAAEALDLKPATSSVVPGRPAGKIIILEKPKSIALRFRGLMRRRYDRDIFARKGTVGNSAVGIA